ncbi:hypothetical protein Acr_18g0007620 [Actinidia rufa]|uniref:Uncharacterized protein n=1 Tax=Actinidia rufa TaxID=165716 RepID=A0A7J0G799_9ERIC|nr:hypothetical protein Acr_18g0007620 [Actinidia rufa]
MEISSSGEDNITSGRRGYAARVSPFVPTQKAKEKAATKDARMKATPQPPLKGVIIQEKCPRESDYAAKKGELDSLKGKEAMLPPPPKRLKSNRGDQCNHAYVDAGDLSSAEG